MWSDPRFTDVVFFTLIVVIIQFVWSELVQKQL